MQMSEERAALMLVNGLDYDDVEHIETTKDYFYFSASIFVGVTPVKHEVRVDAESNIDHEFHVQARPWGSEYWEHVDSFPA